MRIGLIADTHDELVAWDEVLARVAVAFDGVELILHCGDLTTMRALDDLAGLAPVVAVRSDADPPPAPPRLLDGPHVLDAVERDGHAGEDLVPRDELVVGVSDQADPHARSSVVNVMGR